ncbi:MAG: InlB B-repeat-containing protein, partial [Lachnospiraceae bacterium]|nr:InlB B-repeat-containing protein [Lachnospiraceae bacterium]
EEALAAGKTINYTFKFAWDGNEENAQVFVLVIDPNDITLTGKNDKDPQIVVVDGEIVDKNEYFNVTFDADGGAPAPEAQSVRYNAKAAKPADPVKDGCTFLGWFAGDEAYDFETPVKADVALKAKYSGDQYTITWVVDGVETTETYAYGATPVYPNGEPVKAADAQYTYTFKEWTPAIVPVTDDATYTAVFEATLNEYTITWDVDGTLTTETYKYGETPSYKGETPVKAADAQYTYEFDGWTPEIAEVTGEATYTAVFKTTVNVYTITFKNDDGQTLQILQVPYGEVPNYTAEMPTKAATAEYTYTFKGWTPAVVKVTGEATYTATYTATKNTYTVMWIVEGVVTSESYEYGATPSYKGDTPVKASTAQFDYTFAGWTPEIATVTGAAAYTAVFTETVRKYTVKWVVDGAETTETYEYGVTPKYPDGTPEKAADAQYTYTFTGWDPEIASVTGDATYTAQFSQTLNSYTITWNVDGTETTETYDYGETPTYKGETPTKEADAQYTYEFDGWDPEIAMVTGNATYTAKWKTTVNEYTITFVDEDGTTVLQSGKVPYGTVPAYTGDEPTKEATAEYTYTFDGWDPEVVAVVGDATYTAKYKATPVDYTITLDPNNGSEVITITVPFGATIADYLPTDPTPTDPDYFFAGWDPALPETMPAQNLEAKAKYELLVIELDKFYATIPVYGTEQLNLVGNDGKIYKGTWTSSDPSIASVDENGLVTAHKYGQKKVVIIHVVSEDGTYEADCEVTTLFADVAGSPDSHADNYQYFYRAVYWAADHVPYPITQGYNLEYFGVGREATREEFVLFMYRLAGMPKVSTAGLEDVFSDIAGSGLSNNFKRAIAWAQQNGIVKGYTDPESPLYGQFGVGRPITRKEVMIIIWRYSGKPAATTNPDKIKNYTDVEGRYKPKSDTYRALQWAVSEGIANGYTKAEDVPAGYEYPVPCYGCDLNILREDLIVFLYRYAK